MKGQLRNPKFLHRAFFIKHNIMVLYSELLGCIFFFKENSLQTQTWLFPIIQFYFLSNPSSLFSFIWSLSQSRALCGCVLRESEREGPCQRGHIWEGCTLGCLFRSATTAPSPSHHLPVPPLLLCSSLACIHKCQLTALSRLSGTALQRAGTQMNVHLKIYVRYTNHRLIQDNKCTVFTTVEVYTG